MSPHLLDSSIWVAISIAGHIHNSATRAWLDAIDEPDSLYFCRATQQSFLRLMTNSAMVAPYKQPPLTNRQAWAAYQALLADDRIVFEANEPAGTEIYWRQFSDRRQASTNLWMDAYLAAFAAAGGYRFVTTDAAFRQFRGLDLLLLGDTTRS